MTDTEKQSAGIGKGTPGPGRKAGIPNKVTSEIRNMVGEALGKAGGVDYLVKQATENPVAFMGLVGKAMPKELVGPGGQPLFSKIEIVTMK